MQNLVMRKTQIPSVLDIVQLVIYPSTRTLFIVPHFLIRSELLSPARTLNQ